MYSYFFIKDGLDPIHYLFALSLTCRAALADDYRRRHEPKVCPRRAVREHSLILKVQMA